MLVLEKVDTSLGGVDTCLLLLSTRVNTSLGMVDPCILQNLATQQQRGDPSIPFEGLRRRRRKESSGECSSSTSSTLVFFFISKQLVLSLLASLRLPSGEKLVRIFGCPYISASNWSEFVSSSLRLIFFLLVRRDGRKEGVEQVLPVGLRSGQDSEAEAAEEPADEGADDASHEHSLRHLQQLHLQRYQVQLPQGRSHLRGLGSVAEPEMLFLGVGKLCV
ncbi:hypothetical protein TEA_014196 [Camellia sinensis var. sinensis]|uniref:Uncharacterized protein n=1 Tax=Camellia sinensis var. sinensis TaxID=542762 RepID=A0A4V3WJW8_CAMSN|nr:hypothetical protein TEA_014196 [Camellia sinensis var. sinensis]